jgi:hypothetical protein
MDKKDCIYTDMHRSDASGNHFPWKRVLITQVPALVDVYVNSNLNLYTTIQKFPNKEHEDQEVEYCNLAFDFDSSADVSLAHTDAKVCVGYFINNYSLGVSPEELMIYFSGNRGFHVTINAELFEAAPQVDMVKIWRVFVAHLNKEWQLKTLDLAVYTRRRAWRIPNTIHTKTGLYKRALLYSELNSSLENIRELAKSPADWIDLVEVI